MRRGLVTVVRTGLIGAAPLAQPSDHYGMMGNWWWMWFMWIGGFVVLVLLTYLLVDALRGGGRGGRGAASLSETPLDVLKKRYTQGEITHEKYEQMNRDLESRVPVSMLSGTSAVFRRLGQDGRVGQADRGLAGQDEALFSGDGKIVVEIRLRYMSPGFGQQEGGARFEQLIDFAEEVRGIGDLVQHGERQGEVEGRRAPRQTNGALRRYLGLDAVGQPGLRGAPAEHLEHFRLHVNANYLAAGPHHLRHR